jgi:hypothetical protein
MFERFITTPPSQQNAADLFDWVSQVPLPGLRTGTQNFDEDCRTEMLLEVYGSIEGFNILELGPLEASHTHQLEQLGAGSVLAIEASPEFYLKCLIAKEILGLRADFLLGDFNRYLEQSNATFDLIFASGVLYHMSDPVHTLHLASQAAPRLFLWTHYIGEDESGFQARAVDVHGFHCDYFEVAYDPQSHSRGWAGVNPSACRLRREDILAALAHVGFDQIEITEDQPDHPGGPAFSIVAQKTQHSTPASAWCASPDNKPNYYRVLCTRLRAQLESLTQKLLALDEQKNQAEARASEQLDRLLNSPAWQQTIENTKALEHYRLQIEQLQAQCLQQQAASEQLEQILNSRSWKCTAPLRHSGRLLRALFR